MFRKWTKVKFGMRRGWVINDRIFIFPWTTLLTYFSTWSFREIHLRSGRLFAKWKYFCEFAIFSDKDITIQSKLCAKQNIFFNNTCAYKCNKASFWVLGSCAFPVVALWLTFFYFHSEMHVTVKWCHSQIRLINMFMFQKTEAKSLN